MAINSFAALANGTNKFSRKFGTNRGTEVQPFLSGRGFVAFTGIPKALRNLADYHKDERIFASEVEIGDILESSNISLTIPGKQVNTTEFTGLGAITWGVPTTVQTDSTISMRFVEMAATPVLSIFHAWVRMIQDSRAGVSLLTGPGGYTKENYACNVYYWTTQPDGLTVDYAACFTGVFPLKDPSDLFGYDLASVDKVEIDMDFRFDYMFEQDWVYLACKQKANDRRGAFGITSDSPDGGGIITTGYRPADNPAT